MIINLTEFSDCEGLWYGIMLIVNNLNVQFQRMNLWSNYIFFFFDKYLEQLYLI